ncbi:MAG: type II toxin-antitoxin system VapB family antitoxin [Acidobacteriia bacterium]|nr:type II toxin-antitoxin system VapB family antitoxin [Terriglobia bacterium]
MTLNIKNPEVHTLASELARLRKVSVTKAVLDAVRNELTREQQQRRKDKIGDQLIEIGKRCAARVKGRASSADHAALLYDRRGLPR